MAQDLSSSYCPYSEYLFPLPNMASHLTSEQSCRPLCLVCILNSAQFLMRPINRLRAFVSGPFMDPKTQHIPYIKCCSFTYWCSLMHMLKSLSHLMQKKGYVHRCLGNKDKIKSIRVQQRDNAQGGSTVLFFHRMIRAHFKHFVGLGRKVAMLWASEEINQHVFDLFMVIKIL